MSEATSDDDLVDGFDPDKGKWNTANRTKKNKKGRHRGEDEKKANKSKMTHSIEKQEASKMSGPDEPDRKHCCEALRDRVNELEKYIIDCNMNLKKSSDEQAKIMKVIQAGQAQLESVVQGQARLIQHAIATQTDKQLSCIAQVSGLCDHVVSVIEAKLGEAPKHVLSDTGKGIVTCMEKAESRIVDMLKESQACKSESERLQGQLDRKIKQIEVTVMQLKEQQVKVESAMKEQTQVVQSVPKYSEQLKNSAQEIKKFVDIQDKESRECNIILHNIPESDDQSPTARKEHDAKVFQKVATALLGSNTEAEPLQIIRLGKKVLPQEGATTRKSRLMLLKLSKKELVHELLRKRTQLKEKGFPNVYLSKDLSPEERAAEKVLRGELAQKGRETHTIFRGRVVPRTRR